LYLYHLWHFNSGQKTPKIELLLFDGTYDYIAVAAVPKFFSQKANKVDIVDTMVTLLCGQTQ